MFLRRTSKRPERAPARLDELATGEVTSYQLIDGEDYLEIDEFRNRESNLVREFVGLDIHDVRPTIHALLATVAEFVQLLPASEDHHHRAPGGLFVHLVDVATRALRLSNSCTEIKPQQFRNHDYPDEIVVSVQLCMIAHALAHDLGKIATDLQVLPADAAGRRLEHLTPYDPHEYGWFAQTMVEWIERTKSIDPRATAYAWLHTSGRGAGTHERQYAKAISALLRRNPDLFRYTRPLHPYFFEARSAHYRNVVRPLIKRADQYSVVDDLRNHPVDAQTRRDAALWVFKRLCEEGLFDDLPTKDGLHFLSSKRLAVALRAEIPGAHDRYVLANLTKDHRHPDSAFVLRQLQGLGLAQTRLADSVRASRFEHLQGQAGLYLGPELTRILQTSTRTLPPAKCLPKADEAEAINTAVDRTKDNFQPSAEDLDPESRALTEYLLSVDLSKFSDQWAIDSEQLLFNKAFLHHAMTTAKVNRFRLIESSATASEYWALERDGNVPTGVRCTRPFSEVLLAGCPRDLLNRRTET